MGITDAAIEAIADPDTLVFTDDTKLGGELEARRIEVWNLKRIRAERKLARG